MRWFLFISVTIFVISCTSKEEIIAGLKSNDVNTIIRACRELEDEEDTAFVNVILERPYDPRICLGAIAYGRTVYQEKMLALQRISALAPPRAITYKRDSTVVQFYQNWAKHKGLIK